MKNSEVMEKVVGTDLGLDVEDILPDFDSYLDEVSKNIELTEENEADVMTDILNDFGKFPAGATPGDIAETIFWAIYRYNNGSFGERS